MSRFLRLIRHNQGLTVGFALAIIVLLWAWGCHSQVTSIVNPNIFLTRGELDIEVDSFIAQAKLKYAELDQQDSAKSYVFNIALDFMQGGVINPFAVAIVIGNILGLGAVIDNRRKDVLIKTLKGSVPNAREKEANETKVWPEKT